MAKIKLGWLTIPEFLDDWIYRFVTPRLGGIELRQLTVRVEPDVALFAAGGLMGIRTGVSLMVGAVLNYCILAPWMIHRGDIVGEVGASGTMVYGFTPITIWALWGGVAMMTAASLTAFFAKPQVLISSFRGLFSRNDKNRDDVMRDIELPMSVFVLGIPLVGGVVVTLAHFFFDVAIWEGAIAIPLIFIFALIAVNSTALTSITPISALGKLTQLTYSVISPGNITTNLASAGITGEVASNASNLLMDIKPGYMLGAKPRQQAIGHVLGIFAGALVSVPIFYLIFMQHGPKGMITEEYPMPSATVWKVVAELLTKGLSELAISAQWAALVGAILGLLLEAVRIATKGRFWLSGVGIGLAMVIPFNMCLSMFLGSFFFWLAARKWKDPQSKANKILVQNQEPICAGLIAGTALMGIAVALLENFVIR